MIKKILKSKWNLLIMLLSWLLLLWSRTIIGIANGRETFVFAILSVSAITLLCTFLWGCNLFVWDDELSFFYEEDETDDFEELSGDEWEDETDFHSSGLRNSLCCVLIFAVICLFSFAMEYKAGWLDLFSDRTYMQIFWWRVDKRFAFYALVLILFPAWSAFILRKVKESAFSAGAVCSGSVQILALTLMGYLLYMKGSNIWLVEMSVLNVVTVVLAVRGYVWTAVKKKGNVVAFLILYVLFWIALLSMSYQKGQSLADFMGFTDLTTADSYFTNIKKILLNASLIGQSSALLNDTYVLAFMKYSDYLLPGVMFYFGWIPSILLIVVEAVFMVSSAGVIFRNQRRDGRDILLQTIWAGWFIRVAGGILYSFGVPVPIALPFSGIIGIITDTVGLGILLLSFLSNNCTELFELFDGTILEDWDEEYEYDEDEEDNGDDDQ